MLVVKNPIGFSSFQKIIGKLCPNKISACLLSTIVLLLVFASFIHQELSHTLSVCLLFIIVAYMAEKEKYPWVGNQSSTSHVSGHYIVCLVSIIVGTVTMFFCLNNVCWGENYIANYPSVFKYMSSTPHANITIFLNMHAGLIASFGFSLTSLAIFKSIHSEKLESAKKIELVEPLVPIIVAALLVLPAAFKLVLISFPQNLVQVELEGFRIAFQVWTLWTVSMLVLTVSVALFTKELNRKLPDSVLIGVISGLLLIAVFAIQNNPFEVCDFKSSCFQTSGKYKCAIAEIEKAIQLKPNIGELHFRKALMCLSAGDRESAAQSFNRADELGRNRTGVPVWAHSTAQEIGCGHSHKVEKSHGPKCPIYKLSAKGDNIADYSKSREIFLQATQIKPRYSNEYCELNYNYGKLKMFEEAEAVSMRAVEIYPTGARENFTLSLARNGLGKHKEAVIDSSITIGLMPISPGGYCSRGWAYYSLGEYEKAVKDLNHAVGMLPSFGRALYFRANALEKLGKTDMAKIDREMYTRLNYSPETDFWMRQSKKQP